VVHETAQTRYFLTRGVRIEELRRQGRNRLGTLCSLEDNKGGAVEVGKAMIEWWGGVAEKKEQWATWESARRKRMNLNGHWCLCTAWKKRSSCAVLN